MSITINVPCADGSDPDCYGTVEITVPSDASPEEIAEAEATAPMCAACGTDQEPANDD